MQPGAKISCDRMQAAVDMSEPCHKLYEIKDLIETRGMSVVVPRLSRLYFTSKAVFCGFSSMNSSIGGAGAILVNRLAKQLFP